MSGLLKINVILIALRVLFHQTCQIFKEQVGIKHARAQGSYKMCTSRLQMRSDTLFQTFTFGH